MSKKKTLRKIIMTNNPKGNAKIFQGDYDKHLEH